MLHLAHSRRPRRAGEWNETKAVTFIVTLATSRSVTLAAARAGMSRKAVYALKRRDRTFAAWNAAIEAAQAISDQPAPTRVEEPALNSIQGDKVDEVYDPWRDDRKGYNNLRSLDRLMDAQMREIFFSTIANRAGDSRSAPLAPASALP